MAQYTTRWEELLVVRAVWESVIILRGGAATVQLSGKWAFYEVSTIH